MNNDNIFTALLRILDTIPITGEENMKKMANVFQILHRMEQMANEPDQTEEVNADGRQSD